MADMQNWTSVLMLYLIRCGSVVERAVSKVEPSDLFEVGGDFYAHLWVCSRDYYSASQKTIPMHALIQKVADRAQENFTDDEEVTRYGAFLDWVYGVPAADMEEKEGIQLVQKLLYETRATAPLHDMLRDGADITEIYESVQSGIQQATIGATEIYNPFDNIEECLRNAQYTEIGGPDIAYFNLLCGGGMRAGDVGVIFGPPGGFKTTMAIDILCSMAKVHQTGVYITYEQALAKGADIPMRFVARLSGIAMSRLKDPSFLTTITPDEAEALRQGRELAKKYLPQIDRTQFSDTVSDIVGVYQDLARRKFVPELIVIDQLEQWVGGWAKLDIDKTHYYYPKVLDELKKKLAEKYKTRVIVLHQMESAKAGQGAHIKPKLNETSGAKGLGKWVDTVIGLGTACPETGCLWAVPNKVRGGSTVKSGIILRGDYEHYHMVHVTEYEEAKDRPGKFVKRGDANKVPAATTRKLSSDL